jgi:hypothetical protein
MNPAQRELHNIKSNPTFFKAEKVRVFKYKKQQYNTDKVYEKKIQEYNKMKMREYAVINKINNIKI